MLFVCSSDFREASAKQALWFAQELVARGHRALLSITGDVDTGSREGVAAGSEGLTIRAHRFLGPRLAAGDVRAAAAFAPDVIHCWNPRLAAVAVARRYAAASGAPVVVHWEDDEWRIRSDPMGRSRFRRLMRPAKRLAAFAYPPLGVTMNEGSLRWIKRTAAGLDALTPALAEHVSSGTGLPCRVILPVTPEPHPPEGSAVPSPAPSPLAVIRQPVALWTGSVHPGLEADVRLAMAGVAQAQRRGVEVAFAHVGEVLPRYDTTAWAREAGLQPGSAHFLGYVPYPQVPALLREASVLLSPGAPNDYNRLRLPSKVQAYLASGRPTITFAVGFGELLRDREEALLTRTADPSELAELIVAALTDIELRDRLGRGGPLAARRLFDSETNTAALLDYYREVAGDR